jgi:trk system potassium uptake protein TrkH
MRVQSHWLTKVSPPKVLLFGFLGIILIGSLLLSLPLAVQEGKTVSFLDALFTATSATCVTGLVVVDTGTTYSIFGQVVILLLIQVGGLGFMTFSTLFAIALKRKISHRERLLLQEAFNQDSSEGIVRLIKNVMIYSFLIEAVGAVLLTGAWAGQMGASQALYFAVFHSVSLFNNAGFDLFGQITGPFSGFTSMVDDYFVNFISMALVILGAIGFFVLADFVEFRQRRRLTLHSKVVLVTTGALIIVGTIILFLFEFNRTLAPLTMFDKFVTSFFQAVVPRTAGVSTVDISQMVQASQFLIIMLMFIGAAPGSAGGGIKVTAFATMIGAVWSMIRGREEVVLFQFEIARERVYKAITVTFVSLTAILLISMILSLTEGNHPFLMILFETTSAFSTVGLSMGLTVDLSIIGKILICITMFIGRLGPLTLAYMLTPIDRPVKVRHPEGKIII